jgi:hypothetical protein
MFFIYAIDGKEAKQEKKRENMVGELVESMECVKKSRINGFPHPKKENAYQRSM